MFRRLPQRTVPGFIRGMVPGSRNLFSTISDQHGDYRDPTVASGLEQLIQRHQELALGGEGEMSQLLRSVVDKGIIRWNSAVQDVFSEEVLLTHATRRILVVDQSRESRSVRLCGADSTTFLRMLAAARSENPGAELWIMPAAPSSQGHLQHLVFRDTERLLPGNQNPFALLSKVNAVYTVASQVGFEALLAGIPVRVFGSPFYAGWGLTGDECRLPRRTARPSITALFDATYVRYPTYLATTPTGSGTLRAIIDCIELQRSVQARLAPLGPVTAIGFRLWKRRFARPFLSAGGQPLWWAATEPQPRSKTVALWGSSPAPAQLHDGCTVLRMEDGFLHSDGLGSDLVPPRSQVLETQHLYFDSRGPSDLSCLLNQYPFSPDLLARAAALRRAIVEAGLTKYNLGRRRTSWSAPGNRTIVLVPGQVADDASVRYGSSAVRTMEDLLRSVREEMPNAYIVYRPHPDVVSGNRRGLIAAKGLCDLIDLEADIVSLIDVSHEIHTLSSLAGFDGLLRGKKVVTYGMPFYSGWGLTEDRAPEIRWRERTLSLDELVAGALIEYPLYWDWDLELFTTPETVVHQLAPRAARPLRKTMSRQLRFILHVARWVENVTLHFVRR